MEQYEKMYRGYYFFVPNRFRKEQKIYYIGTDGLLDNKYISFLEYEHTQSLGDEEYFVFSHRNTGQYSSSIAITLKISTNTEISYNRFYLDKKHIQVIDCLTDEDIKRKFKAWEDGIDYDPNGVEI